MNKLNYMLIAAVFAGNNVQARKVLKVFDEIRVNAHIAGGKLTQANGDENAALHKEDIAHHVKGSAEINKGNKIEELSDKSVVFGLNTDLMLLKFSSFSLGYHLGWMRCGKNEIEYLSMNHVFMPLGLTVRWDVSPAVGLFVTGFLALYENGEESISLAGGVKVGAGYNIGNCTIALAYGYTRGSSYDVEGAAGGQAVLAAKDFDKTRNARSDITSKRLKEEKDDKHPDRLDCTVKAASVHSIGLNVSWVFK